MPALDELIAYLQALGFSQYEARAYCGLLQKSPANGHEVAKTAGIPTSKVYETLERLAQKGAVLVQRSEPTLWAPVPPGTRRHTPTESRGNIRRRRAGTFPTRRGTGQPPDVEPVRAWTCRRLDAAGDRPGPGASRRRDPQPRVDRSGRAATRCRRTRRRARPAGRQWDRRGPAGGGHGAGCAVPPIPGGPRPPRDRGRRRRGDRRSRPRTRSATGHVDPPSRDSPAGRRAHTQPSMSACPPPEGRGSDRELG